MPEAPAPTQQAAPEQQATPPPLPEVRQCQDPDNFLYGASAVQGDGKWGCMHPVNGGHWATPEDVAEWTVLS